VKKTNLIASLITLVLLSFTKLTSADSVVVENENVVNKIAEIEQLSLLHDALKATKLDLALIEAGPFTILAPTNAALKALPNDMFANLLKPENKDTLIQILTNHVVTGEATLADLKRETEVYSLLGDKLSIRSGGRVLVINKANSITTDIKASNGVIHIIDEVLLPKGE
jgi:uncharacterized surface protein with fasciclin (FAS1) repeats